MKWYLAFIITFSNAFCAFANDNLVKKYEAVVDPNTNQVTLVEIERNPVPDGDTTMDDGMLSFIDKDIEPFSKLAPSGEQAFAHFDTNGEIVEVFYPPASLEDKAFIFEQIEGGGTLKPVGFWDRSVRLPSEEQARDITQSAINAALEVICASNPPPEVMSLDVGLAIALGLEGRFSLNMEWRPARDC